MRVVCRRTGLSAELLRVWERRYQVVTPSRTQTGRRLYSDAEIERLRLLYRATLGGRTIGHVAPLPNSALEALVRQDADAEGLARVGGHVATGSAPGAGAAAADAASAALKALERFDADDLERVLRHASIALPAIEFLEAVVGSFLTRVGTRWREGTLLGAHGHLAAAVTRRVVESTIVGAAPGAPRFLVATLKGQSHEIGAIMAAAAASACGWSVTVLGADLPVDDIADAARLLGARAVGLSLVQRAGDVTVNGELRRLRAMLPVSVRIVGGGASAPEYAPVLHEISASVAADLRDLAALLPAMAAVRAPHRPRATSR